MEKLKRNFRKKMWLLWYVPPIIPEPKLLESEQEQAPVYTCETRDEVIAVLKQIKERKLPSDWERKILPDNEPRLASFGFVVLEHSKDFKIRKAISYRIPLYLAVSMGIRMYELNRKTNELYEEFFSEFLEKLTK